MVQPGLCDWKCLHAVHPWLFHSRTALSWTLPHSWPRLTFCNLAWELWLQKTHTEHAEYGSVLFFRVPRLFPDVIVELKLPWASGGLYSGQKAWSSYLSCCLRWLYSPLWVCVTSSVVGILCPQATAWLLQWTGFIWVSESLHTIHLHSLSLRTWGNPLSFLHPIQSFKQVAGEYNRPLYKKTVFALHTCIMITMLYGCTCLRIL